MSSENHSPPQSHLNMIEVKYQTKQNEPQLLMLDPFWLRDHCRCVKCYNIQTRQRKSNLMDIPANVDVAVKVYTEDGKFLKVQWTDGHNSEYNIQELWCSQNPQTVGHSRMQLWNYKIIAQNNSYVRVNFCDLISKDEEVKRLVTSLIRFGISIIEQVPANPTMTEMAIRRIFPVMKTFFGEIWTFSDDLDHADTAYTKEYIGPHTDNTYFCDAAGLQVLHCLEHVGGVGGENFFIDGFSVANELKCTNLEAFNLLTRVHVPAEYIESGQHHKYTAPIIRIDLVTGEIVQMRLNVYDRATFNTLPQIEMAKFYESFRNLLKIVHHDGNRWTFKLEPGMVAIFDNWRVLHARHAYSGSRKMTGCYVSRTDFLSKARVLGIID